MFERVNKEHLKTGASIVAIMIDYAERYQKKTLGQQDGFKVNEFDKFVKMCNVILLVGFQQTSA